MIPCLYDSREMKFDHNGIGKLADAQSCTVTEKRNGSYELKLICPADGIHAEMLEEGNIILAKPSDTMQPQPFRIYKITTPIDGKLEVQARHISYQLNFITVSPFSVTGCVGAMRGLKSHAASDCPFNVWADVESSATFTLGVPSSFRNCLGGMAGSVLDVFGGEFEWDRYTVKFHKARGADHNVHIIYGKNLTDFKMEKSIENTITGVHPYWVDNETQAVMELPEKVVLQSKRSIPYQKITVLDCTSNFQEKPSEAALREYAQNYIDTTDLTEPEIDIKIDFLQLWNTPGYEDIVEAERVSLCDTVHVFISKLGIEVSSKVTETEYDTLLERYNSITLSNSTVSSRNSSLTGSLNSIRNTATIAYDTAVRAETAVGEQVGGITASIIYDGALFAALFGLTPLLQGGAHVNPVKIGEVEGTLRWTGTNYADTNGIWTFTRSAAGEAVTIKRPTAVRTAFDRLHNQPSEVMILFIGQNGGYADLTDLIRMHQQMISHFKGKEYLVLGLSSGTESQRAEYEKQMKQAFGRRFVSLREYLAHPVYDTDGKTVISCYGLDDAGLDPTDADIERIKQGQVPQTLLADSVHYTAATKTVIGTMLYKKMIELGILEQ